MDASLFDLLIDTTSMVCTITDDAGAHTEPPIAAGPEGGVLKIGERGVVKSGGKIAGGNADAPFVTAIDHGTDTYTYSYSFIESR